MIHKTTGIVLRCTRYSESSLIVSVFTEKFGTQAYIMKGVRKATKKNPNNISFFQPAALLRLEVYHHPQKNLQYIKEYAWAYLYKAVFFDVVKNAIASFLVEILQKTLKLPEENPAHFDFLEKSLIYLDQASAKGTANLPVYFLLKHGQLLGFQLAGNFSAATPVLDLQDGIFTRDIPPHDHYLVGEEAATTGTILAIQHFEELENLSLNQLKRRRLLLAYLTYLKIHSEGMGDLKSLPVLQQLLS